MKEVESGTMINEEVSTSRGEEYEMKGDVAGGRSLGQGHTKLYWCFNLKWNKRRDGRIFSIIIWYIMEMGGGCKERRFLLETVVLWKVLRFR